MVVAKTQKIKAAKAGQSVPNSHSLAYKLANFWLSADVSSKVTDTSDLMHIFAPPWSVANDPLFIWSVCLRLSGHQI